MSEGGEEYRGLGRVIQADTKYAKRPEGKGGFPREIKTKFTWPV